MNINLITFSKNKIILMKLNIKINFWVFYPTYQLVFLNHLRFNHLR